MPCTEPQAFLDAEAEKSRLRKVEQMLCGIATALEKHTGSRLFVDFLAQVDWVQAGVHREEFEIWLAEHKLKDVRQRETERLMQKGQEKYEAERAARRARGERD